MNFTPISAQLNLKIGYNLDYSTFSSHNSILSTYNNSNTFLAEPFKDLHFFSGLQLGVRFRGEYIGTDFTWERSSAEKSSKGINGDGLDVSRDLEYLMNRIGMGLEGYNNYFGIGANVYWEKFSISSPLTDIESTQKVFSNDRFGSRIYLILEAPGSNLLSISLQPYIAIPWSHYNLGPLAKNLKVSTREGFIQENLHFGFSIVFYNGAQRD